MKESANFSMWSRVAVVIRIEWVDHKFRSLSDLLMLRTAEAAPQRCFATRALVMKTRPLDLCLNTAIDLAAGTLRRTTHPIIRIAASSGQNGGLSVSRGNFIESPFVPFFCLRQRIFTCQISMCGALWCRRPSFLLRYPITKVIPSLLRQDWFESQKWYHLKPIWDGF